MSTLSAVCLCPSRCLCAAAVAAVIRLTGCISAASTSLITWGLKTIEANTALLFARTPLHRKRPSKPVASRLYLATLIPCVISSVGLKMCEYWKPSPLLDFSLTVVLLFVLSVMRSFGFKLLWKSCIKQKSGNIRETLHLKGASQFPIYPLLEKSLTSYTLKRP